VKRRIAIVVDLARDMALEAAQSIREDGVPRRIAEDAAIFFGDLEWLDREDFSAMVDEGLAALDAVTEEVP
jgi:hypothetical protein